jgi:signal transduction histidine kinase
MLSLGGLAAGMAHEINNPLAGMIQTAEVMGKRLQTQPRIPANDKAARELGTGMETIEAFMEVRGIPRMLTAIRESGQRVAEIVSNMLSFVQKSDAVVSSHDIGQLLDKTLELATTDYDLKKNYDFKKIEIKREYDPDLPLVPCEAAKIQQVLLNIFRNGAQAMQTAGVETPIFTIRTSLDRTRGKVCMEIRDNGPGMDEHVQKRIFEPFYSTKPVGLGTGLGLSVSYFIIVENHNGEMRVESRPGQGAHFFISLPVSIV